MLDVTSSAATIAELRMDSKMLVRSNRRAKDSSDQSCGKSVAPLAEDGLTWGFECDKQRQQEWADQQARHNDEDRVASNEAPPAYLPGCDLAALAFKFAAVAVLAEFAGVRRSRDRCVRG